MISHDLEIARTKLAQIWGQLNDVECCGAPVLRAARSARFLRGLPFPAGPVKDLAELTDKLWSKSHGLPQATEAQRASVDTSGAWTFKLWSAENAGDIWGLRLWCLSHGTCIRGISGVLKFIFTCVSDNFPININGRKRQGLVVRDAAGTGSIRTEPHAACGKAFSRRQICIWANTAVISCAILSGMDFKTYEDKYIVFLL